MLDLERSLALMVDVPDFPKKGIIFKDMTPIFESPQAFRSMILAMKQTLASLKPTKVIGIESRGFILGAALAYELGLGLVLARKKGKLPRATLSASYSLEYGEDQIEIHKDALNSADRLILVDDVLATGGTLSAVGGIVSQAHAQILAHLVVLELEFLKGRDRLLKQGPVISLKRI